MQCNKNNRCLLNETNKIKYTKCECAKCKYILHDIIKFAGNSLYDTFISIFTSAYTNSIGYILNIYSTYKNPFIDIKCKNKKINLYQNHIVQNTLDTMFRIFINPVLTYSMPIVDIVAKYDIIVNTYYNEYQKCHENININMNMNMNMNNVYSSHVQSNINTHINNGDIFYNRELTQDIWNQYMIYIQNRNRNKQYDDIFDILIIQKLYRVNFETTIAIKTSNIYDEYNIQCIQFSQFYSIMKNILGDAVDIRYRYTYNDMFFASIFNDKSPYRRFKIFDIINDF